MWSGGSGRGLVLSFFCVLFFLVWLLVWFLSFFGSFLVILGLRFWVWGFGVFGFKFVCLVWSGSFLIVF